LSRTRDGECTTVFRTRLNRGQAIGTSLQKIRKSHSIPILTKTRLMKAQTMLPNNTETLVFWSQRHWWNSNGITQLGCQIQVG